MVQSYNLSEDDFRGSMFADFKGQLKGNNDVLCLTKPEIIMDIHRRYLAAGADIVETCSFGSTDIVLAEYGLADKVFELNKASAVVARRACDAFSTPDKLRFVAGSMGPTSSPSRP